MSHASPTYETTVDLALSTAMMEVRNMSADQLRALLADEARLDSIVNNLAQVRSLPSDLETALAQNKSMAEWNLAQEPRITQLKKKVRESHTRCTRLQRETAEMKSKLDSASSSRSLETVNSLLQVMAQEADEQADTLLSRFGKDEMSADNFLKEYVDKKTVAHLRKIKSDKLGQLLRDQHYAARPGPDHAHNQNRSSLPYPMSNSTLYPSATGSNTHRSSFY